MSDYTHLPIPEGYRLVRKGLPRTGETFVYDGGLQKTAFNFQKDTHNIVEKIPEYIPAGWKFVAKRHPREGEWFLNNLHNIYKSTTTWTQVCSNSEITIIEPILPSSNWEFVDYRSPKKGEWYLYMGSQNPCVAGFPSEDYSEIRAVIVKKKEEKVKVKTNLESYSYTPKVDPITPKDVYGENLSKIPKLIKGLWKIIDFRIPLKDEYFVAAGIEAGIQQEGHNNYNAVGPRFIVKSIPPRLPYSDMERMDLIERLRNSYIASPQGGIVQVTRANLDKILDDEFAAQEEG